MTTLRTLLGVAETYWLDTAPGSAKVMTCRAALCVDILGPSLNAGKLDVASARKLLQGLAKRGLSNKSIGDYYATFKRVLALSDVRPDGLARWPKPPKPHRRTRTAMSPGDLAGMVAGLRADNFGETADLAILLNAAGLRVKREALSDGSLRVRRNGGRLSLHITGKGGHEREVPVDPRGEAAEILQDKKRVAAMLSIPYDTHLWRWNKHRALLGLKGLATPHALRHKFATEKLDRTKNLRLVQELLGHSNPATTAIYTTVSAEAMAEAL